MGELNYEEVGRETVRLWQRSMALSHTLAQLGGDVDRMLTWGPEHERAENTALTDDRRRQLREAAAWGRESSGVRKAPPLPIARPVVPLHEELLRAAHHGSIAALTDLVLILNEDELTRDRGPAEYRQMLVQYATTLLGQHAACDGGPECTLRQSLEAATERPRIPRRRVHMR